MRIAIDARYLRAEFSGIRCYSENLLKALAKEDRENEYVVLVHSSYRDELELGDNFEIVEERARPVSLRTISTLGSVIRRHDVDVLHSLFPLAPLGWRKKLIVTVHDLQPLLDPQFTGRRGRVKRIGYDLFYNIAYPALLRKADYLVSVSYATKESLIRLFPDLADKILVVHEGVAPECADAPTQADIERVRAKYDVPQRFLFYLGSTRPNKNLMTMLHAFEEFVRRQPEHDDLYWVMVVTPDRFFDRVFARIRELNLLRRIHIHEQVSEEDKKVFMHLATMLYFVTKFEGFGLPVLEAQAQGLPVLASTHGALPEVASSAAILCDADDPESIVHGLEKFFENPGLRDEMIREGRRNIHRFTWQKTAREILNMYQHLFS
jgi:glycosyltransferase involved in cell wall biosynthesis